MSGIRLLPACLTQRRHVRVNTRSPTFRASTVALCLAAGAGCKHEIAVDPIEVKPIHMTLDINLKVDRELDEFFEDVEETPATAPATQPAAPPATPAGGQP